MLIEALYLNKKKGLELADSVDFVTLRWDGKDRLTASFATERKEHTYTIKRKKNTNYFQKDKKFLIPFPPVYMQHDHRQIRLGTDESSDLLLYYWHRGGGMVLLIAGGGADQRDYRFNKFDPRNKDVWYPAREGNKWGYKRGDSWVIQPQYDYVRLFQDDLARVRQNGKWGVIQADGKMIIPCRYDKIEPFYLHPEGWIIDPDNPNDYETDYILAKVYKNGKEGYINNRGEECIPVIYDKIGYFEDGIAKARLKGRKVTVTYK